MVGEPTIERGMTRINVPTLDGKMVAFAHPFAGPNTYTNVGQEILKNKTVKLSLPRGEQTAFLLRAVYCGSEEFQAQPEAVELRDQVMDPTYLWVFNRNLWVPKNKAPKGNDGVYVQHDKKAIGMGKIMSIDDLESALDGGSEIISGTGIRVSKDGK